MKKVILLLMIAAVVFSCKKNETSTVQPEPDQAYAEVTFNVNQIIPEANRDDFPFGLPECSDNEPVTAYIVIKADPADADPVFAGEVALFTLPGDPNLYTQAIKLMLDCDPEIPDQCCNFFHVTEFYVMDAAGVIIYAAPAADSDAQGFLDYPDRMLNLEFEICEFMKYQVDIDVLCYEDAWYLEFGFVWFNVHEVIMCEVCFFADVCLTSFPLDTPWGPWYNGDFDMIAKFAITADKWMGDGTPSSVIDGAPEDWVPVDGLFDDVTGDPIFINFDPTNPDVPMLDGPLCVPFANYLEKVDTYRFYWHVYLPDGNGGFCFRTWMQGGLLTLEDNCDYYAHHGADDGVIELLVTGAEFCAEPDSWEWYTPTINPCEVREISLTEFYTE